MADADDRPHQIVKPDPDPTTRTIESLDRQTRHERELLETRLAAIETRFNAIDKATELFNANLVRVPTDVDKQVGQLKTLTEARDEAAKLDRTWLRNELEKIPVYVDKEIEHLKDFHGQKFAGVDTQFKERDVRIDQTARDGGAAIQQASLAAKEAVSAALQAAKEAVGKSELVTAEAIKQLSTLMDTNNRALSDKIDTLTARVALIEGRGSGQTSLTGWIFGAAGCVAALLLILERIPR